MNHASKEFVQLRLDYERMMKAQRDEVIWLDNVMRGCFPPFLVKLVTRPGVRHLRFIHWLMVQFSGVRVERNRDIEVVGGKGFKNTYEVLKAIKVKVYKRGVLIEQRDFPLNIRKKI